MEDVITLSLKEIKRNLKEIKRNLKEIKRNLKGDFHNLLPIERFKRYNMNQACSIFKKASH